MRTLNNDSSIKKQIRQAVMATDSAATVILYGSRARGDARPDSDWDVLILLARPLVSIKEEQAFRHRLYDVELATGAAISTMVYSRNDWDGKLSITPLHLHIQQEGMLL